MAKGQHLTRYQKGIVNRYYENQDTIVLSKLSELASDLYLCTDPKKADRLWKSVETALAKTALAPAKAQQIMTHRNVTMLAEIVQEFSKPGARILPPKPGSTAR